MRDALEDYRSYSGGKFAFEFVDPADEAKLEQEAQQYRIQPVQVNVMEKDNLQVKKAYMGIVLIYGDKHETLPFIQNVDNFEYEMTSAIKRLTSAKLPRVGFLGGFGTPDLEQDLRQVAGQLSRHYEVVPVSTAAGQQPDRPEHRRALHSAAQAAAGRVDEVRHRPVLDARRQGRLVRQQGQGRRADVSGDAAAI